MSSSVVSPFAQLVLSSGRIGRSRGAVATLGLSVALTFGCSGASSDDSDAAGAPAGGSSGALSSGGTSAGGMSAGGMSAGGTNAGGASTGGSIATSGSGGGGTASAGASNAGAGGSMAGHGGMGGAAGMAGGGAGGSGGMGGTNTSNMSMGCTHAPSTLKSATVNQATPANSIMVGGQSRAFLTRWPSNYDNKKAYPLHIGLHGATGTIAENGKDNFGLWALAKDSTIFVTLAAVGGIWHSDTDLPYADAVIKQVESELCIDTSKVVLEGFSQGGAMSWFLTASHPGMFRAVIGHSGGGVNPIPALSPVAYLGSLGTAEGNGQNTQTDQFAKVNGCTIETLPRAETGKHVCTPYKGCKEGFPVTWCSYDGGHGFQDTDSGTNVSWVPQAVWDFLKPLLFPTN